MKFKIKKGDTVQVIAGESKGKNGKVLDVNRRTERAIVEGVNIVSKHARPSANDSQGKIEKKEAGIHISNLMLVDGSGKPTRIGRKLDEKTNKLVRYSKRTGEVIK